MSLTSQAALGLHTAVFGGPAVDQARAFVDRRTAALALGGTVLLRDRPAELDDLVDALGPQPSSAPATGPARHSTPTAGALPVASGSG